MFRDKDYASLIQVLVHLQVIFRFYAFAAPGVLVQRFQPNQASLKIKGDAEVAQVISTQNSILREAGRFVNRFQIQDCRTDALTRKSTQHHFWQQYAPDVVGYACCSINTQTGGLEIIIQLLLSGQFFRDDGNAGAGINDEIQRPFNSFKTNLATEESARCSAQGDLQNTGRQ